MINLDEILDLAKDLEAEWPTVRARIPVWHPRLDGEGEGEGEGETGNGEGNGEGEGEEGEGEEGRKVDWKSQSRKHERRARQERKAREEAEKKLKERDETEKTEHEKAIEAARNEEREAVRKESDKERRADRLETATFKLATKGFKVTDEDGKEQLLRFADPDDAHTYVEHMLRRGDLNEDELFDDDGKVQSDTLSEALQELLESKPHLVAGNGGTGGTRKVSGSADGGKGSGGGKSIQDLSVAEHFERIRQNK
jgi:hypothetical protein